MFIKFGLPRGSAATYLKSDGQRYSNICTKFCTISSSETILKIG